MLRYGTLSTRRNNDMAFVAVGPDGHQGSAPVLLVHPINLRKECWLDLVPRLASDRLCVAVDLAGHGESSDDEDFTLQGWVSDCVDLVTSLGLDRCHVVGGSLGGSIALGIAAELPAAVLSVTGMGCDLGGEPHPDPGQDGDLSGPLDTGTVDELFARLAAEAVAPGSPASLLATVRHLTNRHGRQVVRRVLRAASAADARQWVTRVRCPVLVLSGEFDTTCPPESGMRMAAATGGRHEVLDGVGHLPMLEDSTTVLRRMLPHLHATE